MSEYSGDSTQLLYLRARYYNPSMGRFLTQDTWDGDYNKPLSLNRWMYGYGNPVNYNDPTGHFPESSAQILYRSLSHYSSFSNNFIVLDMLDNCLSESRNPARQSGQHLQIDLTGYLALAMTKHGQDSRVKEIASLISAGVVNYPKAYLAFYGLEASKKEWDIKIRIQEKLGTNVVLCGTGINCRWFDYSTPGNIHFGYVAGLAKINQYVAAVAGGILEQTDLKNNAKEKGKTYDPLECFKNNPIDKCDNPQDQAAVDFGYKLAQDPRYRNGITDQELRYELQLNGMNNFQTNPHRYDEYWWQIYPETNQYGPDYFNY